MRVPSTLPNIEEGKRGTRNRFHARPLPPPLRVGELYARGDEKINLQRHVQEVSGGRARLVTPLTTQAPTPRPITRLAIQHATQSQSARHAAKTLARMFMRNGEKLVATRPITRSGRKIFASQVAVRWPSRGNSTSADAAWRSRSRCRYRRLCSRRRSRPFSVARYRWLACQRRQRRAACRHASLQ